MRVYSPEGASVGRTISEKILQAHLVPGAGEEEGRELQPDEFVEVTVDLVLANDVTAPPAFDSFRKIGAKNVFDREKIVLVADHFTPSKDIPAAENCAKMRRFTREQGLTNFYDAGCGIEHVLLPEEGLVAPGDIVIGADSHTCTYGALGAFSTGMGSTDIASAMATGTTWMRVPETIRIEYSGDLQNWVGGKDLILFTLRTIGVDGATYKAIEFGGPLVSCLPMSDRFTMANMAIEAGAKAGLFAVDSKTQSFLASLAPARLQTGYTSDPDAGVERVVRIDASKIDLQVAVPHLPSQAVPAESLEPTSVDQVVIGSCTNGRLEDLRMAAKVLQGRRVSRDVRCLVFPGSRRIALEAAREGLSETFLEAGAVICPPTCGPCLGGHSGVLASGEKALATTNRNFRGRMGDPKSEVYLSGPAVAAATAIAGRIATPREVMG